MSYAIWRACERVNMRPPDVRASWDDCDIIEQANIIAYGQLREYEDMKLINESLTIVGKMMGLR